MLKASGAMAAATLTSRVLGMVREMVYASFMGTTWIASAFLLAFQIPNLFRRLLGEGALTAAFIPIFKEKEKTHGEAEMWRAANAVISGLIVSASAVIVILAIGVSLLLAFGTPPAAKDKITVAQNESALIVTTNSLAEINTVATEPKTHFWTPGQFSEKTVLMLRLLRIMLPYLLLVCLAAVFMGMLNARGHFFIPAMGATMLNVVMIASVYLLAPHLGLQLPKEFRLSQQIFALAFGVLAAGVAQAAFQLPVLARDGFRYRWVSPWQDVTVRRVVQQMLPATIGVAAFQINVVITQTLSYWVDDYVVSSFQYAVRLMELPQGLFGISLATYLLPTLSGLAAEKNYPAFRTELRQGVGYLIFTNLIASVLLVVLAEPIIRLLFERGKFDAASTHEATLALMCLAPGLVAFSIVNVLARAFFALGDTKTPMKISLFCLTLNLLLAVALVWHFNVGLLLFALRKKLARLEMESLRKILPPLLAITAVAGLIAWTGWRLWENKLGHETIMLKIGAVFVPALIAGGIYWSLALLCKIPAAKEMTEFALAKFKRKN
jgi:putative peptidoglycan lipid II flippase